MNKYIGIGLAVISLFGQGIAISADDVIIIDPIQLSPAVPTPHPTSQADPFVDSVLVTLEAESGVEIYFDLSPSDLPLESGGRLYLGEKIEIRETQYLRTRTESLGNIPGLENFKYNLNARHNVAFQSPATTPPVKIGATVTLSVAITDVDNSGPFTVIYERLGSNGWEAMADAGAAPSYSLAWVVAGAAGPIQFRAIATDKYNVANSSSRTITAVANQPPTLTWKLPANPSTFMAPASFSLEVTAADPDGAIDSVEFFQNDTLLGAVTAGPPWVWGRANLPEKVYTFKAIAYDNGPNVLTKTVGNIIVNVVQNKPPTVNITFPENGKTYYADFTAAISANASDPDDKVDSVKFYLNGAGTGVPDFKDSSPPSPFGYPKTFTAATYTISARAYDSTGQSTLSAPITFTVVDNQPPIAAPGVDASITLPTATLQLSGSGSSDPEGTALRYKWSGPPGVTFALSDTIANPTVNFEAVGAGSYKLWLKVTDAAAASDSASITISVQSKPVITSPLTASGPSNIPFSYTLTATGYPIPTLNATGRPTWLSFNPTTGVLSGTPTGGRANYEVALTAQNITDTVTQILTLSIGDSLSSPRITSPLTAIGKVGVALNPLYTIAATGNPSNFTYSATGLPAGLVHNGGIISGTPSAQGVFSVAISVSNSQGKDDKVLAFTINQDPRFTINLPDSLPTLTVGGRASFFVQAVGYPALTYQWQFSANSPTTGFGNVATTPQNYVINPVSTSSAGYYRVTIRNGVGPDVTSRVCRLKVNPQPAPVKITTDGQPTALRILVGEMARFRVKATGEPGPLWYQWFKNGRSLKAPGLTDTAFIIPSAKDTSAGIYRARVTNNLRDTVNPANFAWTDYAALTVDLPKLGIPEANPPDRSFYGQVDVILTHPVPGVAIHYTTGGEVPTTGSTRFNTGDVIRLNSTRTIKAIAAGTGYRPSDIMSVVYTLTAADQVNKPIITPTSTEFASNVQVSISVSPPDARIFYTRNGLHPAASASGSMLYTGPFEVSATDTIIAYAIKPPMTDSDTAQAIYTLKKGKAKIQTPEISPNGNTFSGTQKVTLFCAVSGATLRYTLNGYPPDSLSPEYNSATGIILNATATLNVIGFHPDFEPSDVASASFKLGPGPITAFPTADDFFEKEITVRLQTTPASAEIRYDLENLATRNSDIFPAGGLHLTNTATISALAILDGVEGPVHSFIYTLRGGTLATPNPITTTGAFTFKDSVFVALISTNGAKIYYTKDGTTPAFIPANLYNGAILLDTTTTIQAIAINDGYQNSKMMVATYTLVPEMPRISKTGGIYPLPINVTLDCSSRKADIYWTLDSGVVPSATGKPYVRGEPIPVKFSSTLKAVAIAGNMSSPIAEETYTHFQVQDTLLAPGATLFLEGNYTLRNPENQYSNVQVRIADASPLRLEGFDGVQYSLNLSLGTSTNATIPVFPKLSFTTSGSERRSLYKVENSGQVYFITSEDTVTLGQAGTYFLGMDIAPPRIKYLSEWYDEWDSTRVEFQVDDNVTNLTYDFKRTDNPDFSLSQQPLFSGQQVGGWNKNKPGTLKPLYVQLTVSDHHQASFYPDDRLTMLSLSQKLKQLQGPPAWNIGVYPPSLYDFVSIPMSLHPFLTLKDIRDLNPNVLIEGAEFNNAAFKFVSLPPDSSIRPGRGFWIGAKSPIRSLKLPEAVTLPDGSGTFTVFIKPGWNQIANPHLENLYWPSSRALGDIYKSFPIKGLWEWDPSLPIPDYKESDTLKPWRGYFVYSNLQFETTVTLSPRPVTQGKTTSLAKPGTGVPMQVSLGWGSHSALRLGADWTSSTGLGIEDEPALPSRADLTLRAVRDGRSLASDWVRMEWEGISTWKVAMGGAGDSLPPLKVAGQELPQGWEVWALAPARGMKFRLESGREVPASGLSEDTLTVVAGPREKLAKLGLMRDLALAAPDLDLRIATEPGGFQVRLALPSKARIRATLWSLDGRAQGSLSLGPLSGGSYRFGYSEHFSGRPARLAPGIYFLSLEVKGQGVNARLARKLVLAR